MFGVTTGVTGDGAEGLATVDAQDASDRPVTWLIDNAEAYRALLAACRAARRSIWISQLAFDADCVAYLPEDEAPAPGESRQMRLAEVLLAAANERGVDVRLLLNASLLLDTAASLREHFRAAGADPERLRIRGVSRFPQLLHAKVIVVDGTCAFLIGSPFVNGYWDDSHHQPMDPRRPRRELGGRPLHDLSVRLRGQAVAELGERFAEMWNGADDRVVGDDSPLEPTASTPRGDAEGGCTTVSIVGTAPTPRHAHHPARRTEILDAVLEGIARARALIYIEHQYLSSRPVAAALADALTRQPALEIIVVLNQNPDVTAYRGWQNSLLEESGLESHPRVGLFCLWSVGEAAAAGRRAITQVFVHSKVVTVDDQWAMVGSANLDGVSLCSYGDDFRGPVGRRVFRDVRNFDVAAVLETADEYATSAPVLELRLALWREHLDHPDLDASMPPAGGWLGYWHRCAAAGVRSLALARGGREQRIVVLPYSRQSTPEDQLRDVGAVVASGGLELCFNPSWMEVHLSPNWVRNMFA
jgi:phosphatidylserine/phosphatidylglycerophosphate/cardiolipin synthase-like enzyme